MSGCIYRNYASLFVPYCTSVVTEGNQSTKVMQVQSEAALFGVRVHLSC